MCVILPPAFSDKTLQASSATSDSGFTTKGNGYRSQHGTLAAWQNLSGKGW